MAASGFLSRSLNVCASLNKTFPCFIRNLFKFVLICQDTVDEDAVVVEKILGVRMRKRDKEVSEKLDKIIVINAFKITKERDVALW